MESPKVIITKQKIILNKYSFENELGLSTYDIALISTNKISRMNKSFINEEENNTFLI
tara:strand:- start:255 stop:428 length:174 start_codon:yes stop_codon:yes gene_type:complete